MATKADYWRLQVSALAIVQVQMQHFFSRVGLVHTSSD
eukprot:COSAG02_NODE_22732_length_741_cov_92.838006_2_plen_37_part_01